jgi:hypothetical protein
MQWRKLTNPGEDAVYDADGARLVREAKEKGADLSLKEPLPKEYSGIELICQVEYSLQGVKQAGEGRLRLCDRLDLAGVEALLFDPARPADVIFMGGLPAEVGLDEFGRWKDVQAPMSTILLVLTALVGGATLLALAAHLPWIVYIASTIKIDR